MSNPAVYIKAILGAISAFLTALATALADNSISAQEWVTAGVALVAAFAVVYAIPNKDDSKTT